MIIQRILPFAKQLIETHVNASSVVIDATCGNGWDTQFLAQLVPDGYVYACDIQAAAVEKTSERVQSFKNVKVIHTGHEHIIDYIPTQHRQSLDAAIFNLGYLPKGDKSIVTHPDTTICAIENIFKQLSSEGIIVVVVYPGHPEGQIESNAVHQFLSHFDQNMAHVLKYEFINQQNNPPYIVAIEKR
ncbi:16S rRNA (cytosine(1402)-N(4))-methyltransferase [Staphylococcus felis]|uniref:16S rRNA (Cytosine(1402)-N(4))-methyltransferase n=1 Tax=Staphylococcus felis TaxID=46127 RepID=A0AAX1RYH9_9STAP|nr:class I SAM-dependent methyltransferase [Staphylococcus felis]MBH9580213.1 class I SAM-dependent methyltransferase [Staphylococcus felis]MDM8328500.1 class I SAM-dependent methyltransferase [Staphylococcus felis]MDQ7192267.1 class I SAM-dependent methyltransferase [Staphylococcus felis]REH78352.1 16S rRNA (cytosine(1402)-N(4))-methyltransferase [Staphylococcus felis]REH78417.1 16S rRNA (cytosine(1402)-N(4))-methyltransferase [Staphylococcus felis]